jgi:hypothetical protein
MLTNLCGQGMSSGRVDCSRKPKEGWLAVRANPGSTEGAGEFRSLRQCSSWYRQRKVPQASVIGWPVVVMAVVVVSCGMDGAIGELAGQNQPAKPSASETQPITAAEAERFGPMQRTFYAAALRGSEWIARQQRADGSFPNGLEPALGCPLDEDNYLRQIQAALALAQAARLTGEDRWAARARQAVLVLLAGTVTDPQDAQCRFPRPPLVSTGRLSAAGLLLATIHQLPQPGDDLLESGEQLARWISRQQQADGTLHPLGLGSVLPLTAGIEEEQQPLHYGPGQALWGLMRSQTRCPQSWKIEMLRRARQPYVRLCQEQFAKLGLNPGGTPQVAASSTPAGSPILAVWHLAAWSEAFRHCQERAFAEFVFEFADRLLPLQYTDSTSPLFLGGFTESVAARLRQQPPDWRTGWYAWALVYAANTARLAGDQARFQRYTAAAESALQFVTTLQYTSVNTAHFAPEYQPRVLGGFRRGLRDGVITLEAQQAAVSALWTYLELLARR